MMDLEKFLSQSSNSPSAGFNYCPRKQEFLEEVHDLVRRGLKLFPVSLAAKLNGCPDRLSADATDNPSLLYELSVATQPLWGYRLAIGPSGVCGLVLDGAVGRASFAALVLDLDDAQHHYTAADADRPAARLVHRAVALGDASLRLSLGKVGAVTLGLSNAFGTSVTDPALAPLYAPRELTLTLGH